MNFCLFLFLEEKPFSVGKYCTADPVLSRPFMMAQMTGFLVQVIFPVSVLFTVLY